jgi:hypothetical protein
VRIRKGSVRGKVYIHKGGREGEGGGGEVVEEWRRVSVRGECVRRVESY